MAPLKSIKGMWLNSEYLCIDNHIMSFCSWLGGNNLTEIKKKKKYAHCEQHCLIAEIYAAAITELVCSLSESVTRNEREQSQQGTTAR